MNNTAIDYTALLVEIRHYVKHTVHQNDNRELLYHNLGHTERVVAAADQMARYYGLQQTEYFIVMAASWFHDIGYCIGKPAAHETVGAELANSFLKEKGVDDGVIASVRACIMATQMPQQPVNLLEKIVCDADLFHLGTDDFAEGNKLVRKEFEAIHHVKLSKDDWRRKAIRFLESHHYHTDYAVNLLAKKKEANIQSLRDKLGAKGHTDDEETLNTPEKMKEQKPHDEKTADKPKTSKPYRGIETMFRVTSSNHQRLSDMADNKAHILITVNSIILSAIITLLLRKLDDHSDLLYPTIMILSISLLTLIFSILATRPSIPNGRFTPDDIEQKKVNLLFFGNFYKMSLHDYNEGMLKVMDDQEFLYGSLIRDVYAQGIVLGKKYRLLRIAYSIFMFGLIVSVLAFIVAAIISSAAPQPPLP